MKCEWDALIQLIPPKVQAILPKSISQTAQEVHFRIGQAVEILCGNQLIRLDHIVIHADLQHCINAATKYSPWTSTTIASGYITAPGGHRIGLCGEFTDGSSAISKYTSLCIRIAKDYPGIAKKAASLSGSLLILGKPGIGKTTLLRDLIRVRSSTTSKTIAVVDERRELFPCSYNGFCFSVGAHTDILSGVPKRSGIEMALRNLGPASIALDEITAPKDCEALIEAAWCGVDILATAHATSIRDLIRRPVYRPIVDSKLFDTVIVLQEDKSWRTERISECLQN